VKENQQRSRRWPEIDGADLEAPSEDADAMRVIDHGADDHGCRSKLYRVLRSMLVFYLRREERIGS
jgi:hypothetical protein